MASNNNSAQTTATTDKPKVERKPSPFKAAGLVKVRIHTDAADAGKVNVAESVAAAFKAAGFEVNVAAIHERTGAKVHTDGHTVTVAPAGFKFAAGLDPNNDAALREFAKVALAPKS